MKIALSIAALLSAVAAVFLFTTVLNARPEYPLDRAYSLVATVGAVTVTLLFGYGAPSLGYMSEQRDLLLRISQRLERDRGAT